MASAAPRRRTRDNADRTKQRATAGAWVLEPDERGCATIVANDGRGIARNRPFGPVAAGGDGADSRPVRQTVGAYPRLNAQAPIVPAPAVLRHLRCSPLASTGRQRGEENEALTASAPVAGGRVTDMVINVKFDHPYLLKNHRRPALDAGQSSSSGVVAPQASGAPCQARGDGRFRVESGRAGFRFARNPREATLHGRRVLRIVLRKLLIAPNRERA